MALPGVLAAVQALAGIAGAVNDPGAGDRGQRDRMQNEAYNTIASLSPPERAQFLYHLKDFEALQTPEMKQLIAEQLKGDYYQNVQADQDLINKQKEHMALLEEISKKGMTPEEEAQKNALMRKLAGQQQSAAADIQRQMAQRGMASSGTGLLAQMQAQQQSQANAANQADNLLAQLFQRKLGASGSMADLASNMDKTQFERAMGLARAAQGIDEFNTQLRSKSNEYNVDAANQLALQDWRNRQRISEANVANRQEEAKNAASSYQKAYDNAVDKARLLYGAQTDRAAQYGARGAESNLRSQKGFGSIAAGAQTFGQYNADPENYFKVKDKKE